MEKISLTWLGQSFTKITTPGGKIIFIDPWKDFPPGNKLFPPNTVIDDADLILVTHGHLDHLGDAAELAKNPSAKPGLKIISIFEIMIYLLEQGVPQNKLQGINKGGSVEIGGVTVAMTDAVHSSGIGAFSPKSLVNGGEAAGFVISLEDDRKIYHAGDTDVFGDMKLIGEIHKPDVALLPVGGVFTMGPEGAARAAAMIGAKTIIPIHFGGTFGLPGSPEEFSKLAAKTIKSAQVIIPKAGEEIKI